MPSLPRRSESVREPLAAKVPEAIALFWVIKIVTTFMGEATSDFLLKGVNMAVGAVVEVLLFVIALWLQFRTRHYVAAAYWFLAMAIAIFGTGIADALHVLVGIPYAGTAALWAGILALIFWRWHHTEGTLSIHSITTRRREKYYWATVFATFAFGTALGDLTGSALHWGFLTSGIIFTGIILVPAVARSRFNLNPIVAFWSAYVVTRPLGASFADYFKGISSAATTFISAAVLVVLVAFVARTRKDIQQSPPARGQRQAPEPDSNLLV
ncbi:COG4705 family protein [Actinoallomurus rhizosphaericola]|uniref:COG4705 family protein n=1 Tax=Actinoallomurus rhizosphaericola TaxID=2952536 RepID=UPI0020926322|nr:hypothetical protein [Actinoallomurus rhizosphaericola]MCO5995693.1 hypothetical protein [Actinoallomurus rhizosphaericola]